VLVPARSVPGRPSRRSRPLAPGPDPPTPSPPPPSACARRGSPCGATTPPRCARPVRRRPRWLASGSHGTPRPPPAPAGPPGGAIGRGTSPTSPRTCPNRSCSGTVAPSYDECPCSLAVTDPCRGRLGAGKIRWTGCDARSHRMSDAEGGRVRASVQRPSPPPARVAGNGGVRSTGGKPKERPSHPAQPGEGKAGWVNESEPSMRLR